MGVEAPSFYNIILGRPPLNALLVVISYPHLCIKYPLTNGRVGVIRGDQALARKCYAESVKVKLIQGANTINYNNLDLKVKVTVEETKPATERHEKGSKKKEAPAVEHKNLEKPG